MDLDKLQFKANVRTGWQAVDLGFLMARRWWQALFIASALPPLLLFMPLLLIFSDQPLWAVFIIWWLKPFWERFPLYLASRQIFAEGAFESDVFRQTRLLLKKDFIPWLLWRRFSFHRAFDMPVTVLEELSAKPRAQRLSVLHGKHTDIAFASQLVCFCCELITCFGLFAILLFFIPDSPNLNVYGSAEELTLLGKWIYALCAFFAMILVMPFHCMAGLALYLNRRIELEAWDIEITFRSLSNRKTQSGNSLLATIIISISICIFAVSLPSPVYAEITHNSQSAKQSIKEVLSGEDFGQEKTVKKWRFKNWLEDDWLEDNQDKIPDWLIDFIEWWESNIDLSDSENAISNTAFWLKVLLVGLFIFLLIYLFYRFRGPLKKLTRTQKQVLKPEVMFGLDVRAESLPEDVPAQAMALWQEQKHRESLGLLYRASLSRLIENYALAFKASHTEAECASLVKAHGVESLSQYFSQLTRVWRRLAYGHELPELTTLQNLCENWSKEMADAPR